MEIFRRTPRDLEGAPGVQMTSLLDLARTDRAHVHIAELAAGSSLPKHPAGPDQLFYVVTGRGTVATSDDVPVPVEAGDAVHWTSGEVHTSWAETDMTVLIVQHRPSA